MPARTCWQTRRGSMRDMRAESRARLSRLRLLVEAALEDEEEEEERRPLLLGLLLL